MKTRGHDIFARLFKKEAVRRLLAAALLAAPAAVGAADLYPGNGAAMSAMSPFLYLPNPQLLAQCGVMKTVKADGVGSDYMSISAAVTGLGASLSTNTCVVVLDAVSYAGQVDVSLNTNGYRLRILKDPSVAGAPTLTIGVAADLFSVNADSVTLQGINISQPMAANALRLSGDNNEILDSTVTAANISYAAIYFTGASSNTVSNVYAYNSNGDAARFLGGSNHNRVSSSTLRGNNTGWSAVYLENSSSNTFTASYLHNAFGNAMNYASGASYNAVTLSTVTSGHSSGFAVNFSAASGLGNRAESSYLANYSGTAVLFSTSAVVSGGEIYAGVGGYYAVRFAASNGGLVTGATVRNSMGTAVLAESGSGHRVEFSTVIANTPGYYAVDLQAPGNTLADSYVSAGGTAIRIAGSVTGNSVLRSTAIAGEAASLALYNTAAYDTTISSCYLHNPYGTSVKFDGWGGGFKNISYSTITAGGALPALHIYQSNNVTVAGNYISGSTAAYVQSDADPVMFRYNTLAGNGVNGVALDIRGSFGNDYVSSNTLQGGPAGIALNLGNLSGGNLYIDSNTFTGGAVGLTIPSYYPGSVSFSSFTFRELSPGATAIYITGGSYPYTISSAAFLSPNIAVNVDASPTSGSVTMRDSSGRRHGPVYDYDPGSRLTWLPAPVLPAGCSIGFNVAKDGSGEADTIQAAVGALPGSIATNACVVIRDTATYSEQVTVRNINSFGAYRVRIMADPTFISSAPAVNPPLGSAAAFAIYNDSVSVIGVNVVSTNTVPFGIFSSSPSIEIASVSVISGGSITDSAIALSSFSWVWRSTVTAQAAHAVKLTGRDNHVAESYLTSDGAAARGLYLQAADSNTVTASYIHSALDAAALVGYDANWNTISHSTLTSASSGEFAVDLQSSLGNKVENCFVSNPGGYGINVMGGGNNTVAQSTVTNNSSSFFALLFTLSSSNTVSGSLIYNQGGYAARFFSNSRNNLISGSSITSAAGQGALYLTASSSNTFRDNFISAPVGHGVRFDGASNLNLVARSTVTSSTNGRFALFFSNGSSNTVVDSYLQGSTAAYVNESTATAIGGSVFVSTWPNGVGLALGSGLNFTLSSSTLSGGVQGAAVYLSTSNFGSLALTSNTITGGAYGLYITTQGAGASLSISSLTFRTLTPGATAINFLSGYFQTSITSAAFDSSAIAVNVNGSGLAAGSSVLMRYDSGAKAGPLLENDPSGRVSWPEHACETRHSLQRSGDRSGPYGHPRYHRGGLFHRHHQRPADGAQDGQLQLDRGWRRR